MTYRARRLTVAAVAALGVILAAAVAFHSPPVRAGVFRWLVATAKARYGLELDATGFDYNLFRRSVRLTGVRLAVGARGSTSAAPAFLEADQIDLTLAWALLLGELSFDRLHLTRPRLAFLRRDGRWNLPAAAASGAAPSAPAGLAGLGRITVDTGALFVEDASAAVGLAVPQFELDVAPRGATLRGTIRATDGARVHRGANEIRLTHLAGQIAFDGRAITLDAFRIEAPACRVEGYGRIDEIGGTPRFALVYRATLQPQAIAARWPRLAALAAPLEIEGEASGPVTALASTARLTTRLAEGTVRAVVDVAAERAGPAIAADATYENLALDRVLAALAVPVRLRGQLAGRLEASWSASAPGAGRLQLVATARPAAGRRMRGLRPPDLVGEATLDVEGLRWRFRQMHRIGEAITLRSQAGGVLDRQDPLATRLAGALELTTDDLGAALRVLERAGVTIGRARGLSLAGVASGAFQLGGTLGNPYLDGRLSGSLELLTSGASPFEARLHLDRKALEIAAAELTDGPNRIRGEGRLDLERKTLAFAFDLTMADAARWLHGVPPAWRPTGSISAVGGISGRLSRPALTLGVTGEAMSIAGQRIDRVAAHLRLANGRLLVENVTLEQSPGGRLTFSGWYRLADEAYRLTASFDELAIWPSETAPLWMASFGARIAGHIDGEGTRRQPMGSAELILRAASWGGTDLGDVEAGLRLAGETIRAGLRAPTLGAHATAVANTAAPHRFTVRAALEESDLGRWAAMIGVPSVSGRITARLEGSGILTDLTTLDAEAHIEALALQAGGGQVILAEPARLRFAGGHLAATGFELRTGRTRVTASGLLSTAGDAPGLVLAAAGDLGDLAPFVAAVTTRAVRVRGQFSSEMRVAGTIVRPSVDARLAIEEGAVVVSGWPELEAVAVRASVADNRLIVDRFHARVGETGIAASLRLPLRLVATRLPEPYRRTLATSTDPARAEIHLAPITAASLRPWLPEAVGPAFDLDASATVGLEAADLSIDRLSGELTLDRFRLTLAGLPLEQQRPTRLRLATGRLEVVEWAWAGGTGRLELAGGLDLAAGGALALGLRGTVDLQLLGAFAPGGTTAGTATVDLRVEGTWLEPRVAGTVEIADAELRLREPRLVVSDVRGILEVASERLVVRTATGLLNGGPFELRGRLEHERFLPVGGALALRAEGVAVAWPQGLRAEAAGDVVLAPTRDEVTLSGRVTILRGAYREPLLLGRQLLAALGAPGPFLGRAPSWRARVGLDVAVVTEEDLLVDNNYGRFSVAADLRMGGTLETPGFAGRLSLGEGGRLFLGGREYRIERAAIDVLDPQRFTPELDLVLWTRVAPHEITVSLRGTPDRLVTELRADDPTLSQTDVVSLLVTGQRASEAGLADVGAVRDQMLRYFTGDLLGLLGQQVGFDVVRLERGVGDEMFGADPALVASETDPAARLSLSKRLSPRIELLLSQNLHEPGRITWIGTYRFQSGIELRAVARDDESRAAEVSQRVQVGAPWRAAGKAEAPSVLKVAEVTVRGTPGVPLRALVEHLKLRAGDRFDFVRWQEDRERLESWYRRRGFLEVRVRAERERLDPGSVRLVYHIDRGRRTGWRFEGYTPSARLLADIASLWAASVFDRFFVEDVEARIRRELAREGFLRADVKTALTTSVEENPPMKLLQVRVIPGPRTAARRIEFRGNVRLKTATLEELVRAHGLDPDAWLAPQVLARALRDRYLSEGLLGARVVAGPPVFDDARAVLSVTIHEGPIFRIARLRIEGTRRQPQAELLRVAGLAPGSPYRPAVIEQAQRAIEAAYRREGYNHVRTRFIPSVDEAAATVSLLLVVDEGPRQVLDSIIVEGTPAREALVRRVVGFEPGHPVDRETLYRARKRLYDTGVFSRADIQLEPVAPSEAEAAVERIRARIVVAEPVPYRIRYGLQVGDRVAPEDHTRVPTWGAVTDLERRNLFGGAVVAGVTGRYEPDRRLVRGFFRAPRLSGLPLASSLYIARSRQQVTPERGLAFVTDRATVTAQQDALFGWGRATYSYSFARDRTFARDAFPDDPLAQGIVARVARLTGAFVVERRDDPFDPVRGWFHASTMEYAASWLGSDLSFIKYSLQTAAFVPAGRAVVAGNLRLGLARGVGQELIVSERYRAGGSTSVRGYGTDALGPTDIFGAPAGGNAVLVLNGELRVPLLPRVRGVAFLDAGNVFARPSTLRLGDLKIGVGFGARIESPVGLVRIDFALPVPRPVGERRGRWYFSLGHMF